MVERDGQWAAGMGRHQTKKPWNGSMPTLFLDNRPVKTWFFLLLEVFERFSLCEGCVISKVGQGTKSPLFFLVWFGED